MKIKFGYGFYIFKITVFVTLALLLTILVCDKQVKAAAAGRLYSDTLSVPFNKTGLLLGTSKYLARGGLNPYYSNRLRAAASLLRNNRVSYLVISGDNGTMQYNEPYTMKKDLCRMGIDSSRIFLDYAGFRTFDSMVRLREIFSQDSVTVISQQFHNERALFIAAHEGITALGFNAEDVSERAGLKTQIREKFARVKVYLDYLFGVEPKFLGPKVQLPA